MGKSRIPASTLYRFPILFGGILVASIVAFINRERFLEGNEERSRIIFKEDPEARNLIPEAIRMIKNK